MKRRPWTLPLLILLAMLGGLSGCAQDRVLYDETADARQDIQRAITEAGRDGKHILLMFGGNWCGWCSALHHLFQSDPAINEVLTRSYVLVMVDVGRADKNLDLNERYGNPYQHGFPVLVVLDGAGVTAAVHRPAGGRSLIERQNVIRHTDLCAMDCS